MTDRLTDEQLVLAAQRGDAERFGELVRRYQHVAFRVAFVVTRSAAEAQDVTQEAFVKAWRAIDRFTPDRPFRPWLLRIVSNEAKNRNRSAARRARHVEIIAARDRSAIAAQTSETPESDVMRGEEQARVIAALERLPEWARTVLHLRYILDLDEVETAAALGLPKGTVKSRTNRAKRRLAQELESPDA